MKFERSLDAEGGSAGLSFSLFGADTVVVAMMASVIRD